VKEGISGWRYGNKNVGNLDVGETVMILAVREWVVNRVGHGAGRKQADRSMKK
jgi:hypothetical protein